MVGPPDAAGEVVVRVAVPADLAALVPIEHAAEALFHDAGVAIGAFAATSADDVEYAAAIADGRVLVAVVGDVVVGFAHLVWLDGHPHLEEIDVHPDYQRRGIGAALVDACVAFAAGADRITLSTFRDLPWNAPFYAAHGFRTLDEADWTDGLRALREHERRQGLDVDARVLMERRR